MVPPSLSPLQLKDYKFTNVRVKVIESGSASGAPALKPSIWFGDVPNTPNQWRLVLTLELTSADPAKPFLYEADIQLQGTVEVNESFPPEKKEQLAIVNGMSILYSAAREILLNITARSAGAVNLPTLSFVKMVTEALKQKAEQPKPTAEAPAQSPPPAARPSAIS